MFDWFFALGAEEWTVIGGAAGVAAWLGLTPQNARYGWRRILGRKDEPQAVRLVQDAAAPPPEPAAIRIGLVPGREILGRERELAALGVALGAGGRVVLAGQGGVGKSSVARLYAETAGKACHGVVWTRAGTRAEVIGGLMAVGGALGMTRPEVPQLADAQAVLARVAATGRRWLFIYDNVESLSDIQALIPDGAHLVVTTRAAEGWPGFAVQRPEVLDFDTEDGPAVRLLQVAAGREGEAAAARALAQALGGQPLALVVAGALIQATSEGYAAYAGRLAEVLAHVPANEDYSTSVIGAVTLSYDALSDDAKAIADLCAWWAAEGLGPELLTAAPGGAWWELRRGDVPEAVQALVADAARVRAGFVELAGRSLLTREGEAWAMHRMTALALRLRPGARPESAVALLKSVYPGGEKSPEYAQQWPLCVQLTPHVRAIWATGEAPETEAMDKLLNQSAIYLGAIADYPGAAELSAAGLARAEARLAEGDRDLAVALGNHGTSLTRLGDLAGARALLERALALDALYRPGSVELANKHDLLGGVLMEQGRAGQVGAFDLAVRFYQQALVLRRQLFGRGAEVAQTLNNLSGARDAQGRVAAAARLIGASLRIVREVLPLGDARLGYGLLNTGAMWLTAGRADLAEPLLREALELWQGVYAAQPQHPDTRNAAGWLILCLLRRAAAEENRGLREMEARKLCEVYGFDFEERKVTAMQHPYAPEGAEGV